MHSLNGQNLVLVSSLVFLTFLFCPLITHVLQHIHIFLTFRAAYIEYTATIACFCLFYTWKEGHFKCCRAVYYYIALSWLSIFLYIGIRDMRSLWLLPALLIEHFSSLFLAKSCVAVSAVTLIDKIVGHERHLPEFFFLLAACSWAAF